MFYLNTVNINLNTVNINLSLYFEFESLKRILLECRLIKFYESYNNIKYYESYNYYCENIRDIKYMRYEIYEICYWRNLLFYLLI